MQEKSQVSRAAKEVHLVLSSERERAHAKCSPTGEGKISNWEEHGNIYPYLIFKGVGPVSCEELCRPERAWGLEASLHLR